MASRFVFKPGNADPGPSTNRAAYTTVHTTEMREVAAFDPTTQEAMIWSVVAPQGWTGTPHLFIQWFSAGTTNTVGWLVSVEAITPTDSTDLDSATSYDTANTGTAVTVPGTAGFMVVMDVTLTNHDSSAAGDALRIKVERDVTNDTSASDAFLYTAELRDSA